MAQKSKALAVKPMTRVPSLGSTWWNEITVCHIPSNHVCAVVGCMQTKQINKVIKKF